SIKSHKKISKKEANNLAKDLLKKVGIARQDEILNSYPHQLSGGMRQRVMIAMAISCSPKLLIADEPTTALDVTIQAQILDLLKELQKETQMAIMMITHEMRVIKDICNRVAVMEKGQVVETGTVKEVFSHPKTTIAQNFVSTVIQTEPSTSLIRRLNDEQVGDFKDYKIFVEETQVTQPIINDLIQICGREVKILFSSMSEIQGNTVCYMWLRFN
ncbi:ATP-binding cassette domain-containing protein, partial [Acinetobacter baumannii]|nr:ATP-binding cassette domain-containing protein [Acinetobacter baumannii]